MYDNKGNKSSPANLNGKVFGAHFEKTRQITNQKDKQYVLEQLNHR